MAQKILMVDDDPLVHKLYGPHLERAGYQVLSAANGREALEIAERERPNLVIMDVMMAEMDGLTAVRHLKQMEAGKDVPVIIFTANANTYELLRHESGALGAALLLTKPVSPGQILDEVHRLLSPGGGNATS